ncbi:homeobox-like protein HDP1 [Condylostylus longicornis]|uniref:homeobox-like protein HDP1 n=1 Tax=Condylostylus longicornis TaxID=2530218 RepID=UPI00244DC9D1|nr:homeobox-like protein HDP1 [Condylostylus longicornis]
MQLIFSFVYSYLAIEMFRNLIGCKFLNYIQTPITRFNLDQHPVSALPNFDPEYDQMLPRVLKSAANTAHLDFSKKTSFNAMTNRHLNCDNSSSNINFSNHYKTCDNNSIAKKLNINNENTVTATTSNTTNKTSNTNINNNAILLDSDSEDEEVRIFVTKKFVEQKSLLQAQTLPKPISQTPLKNSAKPPVIEGNKTRVKKANTPNNLALIPKQPCSSNRFQFSMRRPQMLSGPSKKLKDCIPGEVSSTTESDNDLEIFRNRRSDDSSIMREVDEATSSTSSGNENLGSFLEFSSQPLGVNNRIEKSLNKISDVRKSSSFNQNNLSNNTQNHDSKLQSSLLQDAKDKSSSESLNNVQHEEKPKSSVSTLSPLQCSSSVLNSLQEEGSVRKKDETQLNDSTNITCNSQTQSSSQKLKLDKKALLPYSISLNSFALTARTTNPNEKNLNLSLESKKNDEHGTETTTVINAVINKVSCSSELLNGKVEDIESCTSINNKEIIGSGINTVQLKKFSRDEKDNKSEHSEKTKSTDKGSNNENVVFSVNLTFSSSAPSLTSSPNDEILEDNRLNKVVFSSNSGSIGTSYEVNCTAKNQSKGLMDKVKNFKSLTSAKSGSTGNVKCSNLKAKSLDLGLSHRFSKNTNENSNFLKECDTLNIAPYAKQEKRCSRQITAELEIKNIPKSNMTIPVESGVADNVRTISTENEQPGSINLKEFNKSLENKDTLIKNAVEINNISEAELNDYNFSENNDKDINNCKFDLPDLDNSCLNTTMLVKPSEISKSILIGKKNDSKSMHESLKLVCNSSESLKLKLSADEAQKTQNIKVCGDVADNTKQNIKTQDNEKIALCKQISKEHHDCNNEGKSVEMYDNPSKTKTGNTSIMLEFGKNRETAEIVEKPENLGKTDMKINKNITDQFNISLNNSTKIDNKSKFGGSFKNDKLKLDKSSVVKPKKNDECEIKSPVINSQIQKEVNDTTTVETEKKTDMDIIVLDIHAQEKLMSEKFNNNIDLSEQNKVMTERNLIQDEAILNDKDRNLNTSSDQTKKVDSVENVSNTSTKLEQIKEISTSEETSRKCKDSKTFETTKTTVICKRTSADEKIKQIAKNIENFAENYIAKDITEPEQINEENSKIEKKSNEALINCNVVSDNKSIECNRKQVNNTGNFKVQETFAKSDISVDQKLKKKEKIAAGGNIESCKIEHSDREINEIKPNDNVNCDDNDNKVSNTSVKVAAKGNDVLNEKTKTAELDNNVKTFIGGAISQISTSNQHVKHEKFLLENCSNRITPHNISKIKDLETKTSILENSENLINSSTESYSLYPYKSQDDQDVPEKVSISGTSKIETEKETSVVKPIEKSGNEANETITEIKCVEKSHSVPREKPVEVPILELDAKSESSKYVEKHSFTNLSEVETLAVESYKNHESTVNDLDNNNRTVKHEKLLLKNSNNRPTPVQNTTAKKRETHEISKIKHLETKTNILENIETLINSSTKSHSLYPYKSHDDHDVPEKISILGTSSDSFDIALKEDETKKQGTEKIKSQNIENDISAFKEMGTEKETSAVELIEKSGNEANETITEIKCVQKSHSVPREKSVEVPILELDAKSESSKYVEKHSFTKLSEDETLAVESYKNHENTINNLDNNNRTVTHEKLLLENSSNCPTPVQNTTVKKRETTKSHSLYPYKSHDDQDVPEKVSISGTSSDSFDIALKEDETKKQEIGTEMETSVVNPIEKSANKANETITEINFKEIKCVENSHCVPREKPPEISIQKLDTKIESSEHVEKCSFTNLSEINTLVEESNKNHENTVNKLNVADCIDSFKEIERKGSREIVNTPKVSLPFDKVEVGEKCSKVSKICNENSLGDTGNIQKSLESSSFKKGVVEASSNSKQNVIQSDDNEEKSELKDEEKSVVDSKVIDSLPIVTVISDQQNYADKEIKGNNEIVALAVEKSKLKNKRIQN